MEWFNWVHLWAEQESCETSVCQWIYSPFVNDKHWLSFSVWRVYPTPSVIQCTYVLIRSVNLMCLGSICILFYQYKCANSSCSMFQHDGLCVEIKHSSLHLCLSLKWYILRDVDHECQKIFNALSQQGWLSKSMHAREKCISQWKEMCAVSLTHQHGINLLNLFQSSYSQGGWVLFSLHRTQHRSQTKEVPHGSCQQQNLFKEKDKAFL